MRGRAPGWFLYRWQYGVFLHRPATASIGRASGAYVWETESRAYDGLGRGGAAGRSSSERSSSGASGSWLAGGSFSSKTSSNFSVFARLREERP